MYDETLRPQTRLGDYLIRGVLGSGAFGITYLAEDRQQRCNVAIKEYYLRPLLRGLKDIHARWLLHRDIKPDNIYPREDGTPVLIDFGTARHVLALRGQGMTTYLTPGFAPPEQLPACTATSPNSTKVWLTTLLAASLIIALVLLGKKAPQDMSPAPHDDSGADSQPGPASTLPTSTLPATPLRRRDQDQCIKPRTDSPLSGRAVFLGPSDRL